MPNVYDKVNTNVTIPVDDYVYGAPLVVYAKQNDSNSRVLTVRLTSADGNLYLSGNGDIVLNATKPNGDKVGVFGALNENGSVTFTLPQGLLDVPGDIKCDVSFVSDLGGGILLTSTTFIIRVEKTNYDSGADTAEDLLPLSAALLIQIGQAKSDWQELVGRIDGATRGVAAYVDAANVAAQSANNFAKDAREYAREAISYADDAAVAASSMAFCTFGITRDGHLIINRAERLGTTTFTLNEQGHLEVNI